MKNMNNNKLTWSDAIEKVMLNSGYFATLKQLHEEAPKFKQFDGKTPNKTINERVQRDKRFTKIMPGLWALTKYLSKLPKHINPNIEKNKKEVEKVTHSLIQGYIIEIGNIKGFSTFSPDKNGFFLNKKIGDIITLPKCPSFTYEHVLQHIKFIDVIWFNNRKYPSNIIEVEHSTPFKNSFLKFLELQDFATKMTIVAPKERYDKYEREISRSVFNPIYKKVKFVSYDQIEKQYTTSLKMDSFLL